MSISNKSSIQDERGEAVRCYSVASDLMIAVGHSNRVAGAILSLLTSRMDFDNECEITIKVLSKFVGRKNPATITKALNILRLTNLVEIKHKNRIGSTLFRVNGRAFSRDTDDAETNDNIFRGELDDSLVGEYWLIDKTAIRDYRVNPARKVKNGGAV